MLERSSNREIVLQSELMVTSRCVQFGSLFLMVLASCKPVAEVQDSRQLTIDSEGSSSSEILTSKQNTTLKKFMTDATSLATEERCPIPEGTQLTAESIKAEGIDHWRVFNLTELKLPTGEIAKRVRVSNEQPIATPTPTASPISTPAAEVVNFSVTTSSDGLPREAPATEPQATVQKNPAELLNCVLLESDNFLVYSPHFLRQVKQLGTSGADAGARPEQGEMASKPSDDFGWMWPTRSRTIRNDAGGSGYFNAPRASGRGHQGLDILASVGEPIYAARSGTIIDPNWEGAYGKVVDVRHDGGYLSRYAHLNSFTYSHGTYVEKGSRIATSGRTGNASGYGIRPHLHFEIRRGARLLNPQAVLP